MNRNRRADRQDADKRGSPGAAPGDDDAPDLDPELDEQVADRDRNGRSFADDVRSDAPGEAREQGDV